MCSKLPVQQYLSGEGKGFELVLVNPMLPRKAKVLSTDCNLTFKETQLE